MPKQSKSDKKEKKAVAAKDDKKKVKKGSGFATIKVRTPVFSPAQVRLLELYAPRVTFDCPLEICLAALEVAATELDRMRGALKSALDKPRPAVVSRSAEPLCVK